MTVNPDGMDDRFSVRSEDTAVADDDDDSVPVFRMTRRNSVSAEPYDPSKFDSQHEEHLEISEKTQEQKARIRESIRHIFLFRGLDENQLNQLINAMSQREVKKGQVIIRQGDEGDYFYVIESGTYEAFIDDEHRVRKKVKTYEDQGFFGELSLMYNEPRAATVVAGSDGLLWTVSRRTFQCLVLRSAYEKRKRYEEMLRLLPELAPLSAYDIMNVCDALVPRVVEDGQIVFREGDVGDGMYFIEKGAIQIVKSGEEGHEKPLAVLFPGSYFGELALMKSAPRVATARAHGKCHLAFLDRESFERLMGPCVELFQRRSDSYRDSDAPNL